MVRTRAAWLFLILLVWTAWPLQGKREKWPHERSELAPAPEVQWGALDNGFGYALMPRAPKPGLISLRLVVAVGPLDEREEERGLAHFVEHMAFRGTRHFERGEMVDFFRELGMGFGVDVNAFTYHDKTVYHLELPNNDPSLVAQALLLLRDYADGIVFDEASLEKERSVILLEKRARSAPSSLALEEAARFAFDGTLLAERHPIGLDSVILGVSLPELQAFYDRWYRPDLMTLVAAGDFDAEELSQSLENVFGTMPAPKRRPPKRKLGRLARGRGFRLQTFDVAGVERHTLQMARTWMERPGTDSWKSREREARRRFATDVFNERCRRAVGEVGNDFAFYDRVMGIPYCHLTISAGGPPSLGGFIWMDRMLRQAIEHGFSAAEIDRVKRDWRQRNRAEAARYQSAEPRLLVDQLVEGLARGEVYVGMEEHSSWLEGFLESLDADAVSAAFADLWKLPRLHFFMVGDFEQAPFPSALRDELAKDRKLRLPPYWLDQPEIFAYSDFGPPGSVVARESHEEIGAVVYRFSNNARLVFMRTEHERETTRALIKVGGGLLAFSDRNPATHALAMDSLFRSGFGQHSIETIYDELRGSVNAFFFGVDDHDAFAYRAIAPSDRLEPFLRIVAEFLHEPRIDEAAFVLARTKLRQSLEMEADGLEDGYRAFYRLLYSGEARFHDPSLDDIDTATVETVRAWLEDPLRDGYLEAIIVGDAEEAAVVEAFARTLGSLREREAVKPGYEEARALKLAAAKGQRRIEYQNGKGDNAAAIVVWTLQEDMEFREGAAANVLAALLEERLRKRLREEMGASYAPQVDYVTFAAYNTLRHIRADVDCLESHAEDLLEVILEVAEDLAAHPVSSRELAAAVAPMEESIRQAWQDNGFLVENVLYGVDEYPFIARNALRYRDGALSSLTVEEIQQVARKFLKSDEALAVAIVPGVSDRLVELPLVRSREPAGMTR